MQKLIDLLRDIIAWFKKIWNETGEWTPSVVETKEVKKGRGRPKGSKNKKK